MPVYATRESDGIEKDQPEQEPKDDQYRDLQEEIRMKDANTAAMTTKMDALMAQLQTRSGIEQSRNYQYPIIKGYQH